MRLKIDHQSIVLPFLLLMTISVMAIGTNNSSGKQNDLTKIYNHSIDSTEELRVRSGLPNFFNKLNSQDTMRIGYFGGSITKVEHSWRNKTFNWLQAEYPHIKFIQLNESQGSTGADIGCFRAAEMLPENPDLVFVEYRVNGTGGFKIRATEGLVRQIWKSNPETDICFVHTMNSKMIENIRNGLQGGNGQFLEQTANVYGIPSIDMGVEVVKLLDQGKLTYQAAEPEPRKIHFSKDGTHPTSEGQDIYVDIITRSLMKMKALNLPLGIHHLHKPIVNNNLSNVARVPVATVLSSNGWEPVSSNEQKYKAGGLRTKKLLGDAYKCHKVGETISIKWDGLSIGFSSIAHSDGIEVEVSVDGGDPIKVDLTKRNAASNMARWYFTPDQKAGSHTTTIKLTKLPEGTEFYCGHILIIGDPIDGEGDSIGISTSEFQNIKMYPNPVINNLTITGHDNIQQVVFYSLTGTAIKVVDVSSSMAEINMQTFASGAYLVQVCLDNGNVYQHKIIRD